MYSIKGNIKIRSKQINCLFALPVVENCRERRAEVSKHSLDTNIGLLLHFSITKKMLENTVYIMNKNICLASQPSPEFRSASNFFPNFPKKNKTCDN